MAHRQLFLTSCAIKNHEAYAFCKKNVFFLNAALLAFAFVLHTTIPNVGVNLI